MVPKVPIHILLHLNTSLCIKNSGVPKDGEYLYKNINKSHIPNETIQEAVKIPEVQKSITSTKPVESNKYKICKVKKDAKSLAYAATAETIKSNQYPITRYLYMYLRNRPTGDIKKYIDWILSAEGQKVVTEVGYFPVK